MFVTAQLLVAAASIVLFDLYVAASERGHFDEV